MKKIIAGLALAGLLGAASPVVAGQQVVEEIVAVVNDDIITLSDYRQDYALRMNDLRAQQLPADQFDKQVEVLKKELLNLMIMDILLLQKAKELGLNVQEQLKAMIEKLKTDNSIASDADFRRAIEQQGMPYEMWLKQYEEGMMRQGVLYTEVERAIVLEDSEVVQYYKKNPAEFTVPTEYKLSAIYIAGEGRSAEELETLKAAVDAKLKTGTSFTDTATELSDPPMKEAKGELGSFKTGELEAALEEPVKALKAGETTAWIANKGNWWLLHLVEKTDSYVKPFEDARKEVEERIYNEKRAVKSEAFIKTLREQGYVKILNPDPLGFNK